MLRSEALVEIRAATRQDGAANQRVSDTQLQNRLILEYQNFRREIRSVAPALYTTTSATQALTAADPLFDLPADYDTLIRFERQYGAIFLALSRSDDLNPELELGYEELADKLQVQPADRAAGTYRLVYVKKPTVTGDYTVEVPSGCELILIERVAAWVCTRLRDDPSQHLQNASRMWNGDHPGGGQKTAIRRRYGRHPEGGLAVET